MKIIFILLITMFLSSCQYASAVFDASVGTAAQVYDRALVEGENTICKYSSVGSVMRRYGTTVEGWEKWKGLCLPPSDLSIEKLIVSPTINP